MNKLIKFLLKLMNVHVMKTCWCRPLQSVACTNPFPSLLVHRTRKAHVELTNELVHNCA